MTMTIADEGWSPSVPIAADEPDMVEAIRSQWIGHGWADAAEGVSAVVELMRVCSMVTGRVDAAVRPFSLTMSRYEVLMLLFTHRTRALSVTTMSRLLQVHSTSVTNAVQRLEVQGLVRRSRHTGDSRRVVVSLTPHGTELAETAAQRLNAHVFADLGISDAEHDTLWRVLRSLRRSSGDF